MAAVEPMAIDRNAGECSILSNQSNLFVKQTKKGCFQELCGCEANTEFKIATMDKREDDIYYALENTSCCVRFCCRGNRPFQIDLWSGKDKNGIQIGKFQRPFRCMMANCKCCCYQEISAVNSSGVKMGSVKENCWLCVPSFDVKDADNKAVYLLKYPTCCMGLCINCCAEGCCNCRIPFYIYDTGDKKQVGKIVKVWGGLGQELFTDADKFELEYPPDADASRKMTLLGATFFLNALFFESQKGGGGP